MVLRDDMLKKVTGFAFGCLGMLAFIVSMMNANSTCLFVANQPELPEEVKQLGKYC